MQNPRIIFMGTPEFAVASLEALLKAGLDIAAVVTAPDKPAGRGMKITESAVKKFAAGKGLKILQPEKLKDPLFFETLGSLRADLQIVVAFRMLPESVWNMPPMGTINLHGSLLPQYRGAAPINWAIINGETETGVTTFKLQHDIDTGDILMQESYPIGEDETAGEVLEGIKYIGAGLLVKTIKGLTDGTLNKTPQSLISHADSLKPAPKIIPETCKINWDQPVTKIYNLVRGLSPSPGAYTFFDGKMLKIFKSKKEEITPAVSPGNFETDKKTFLKFVAADGYIHAEEIQLEGKKKMPVGDFLRGYRLK
jgi:methionyl-tRNA formyltransferase